MRAAARNVQPIQGLTGREAASGGGARPGEPDSALPRLMRWLAFSDPAPPRKGAGYPDFRRLNEFLSTLAGTGYAHVEPEKMVCSCHGDEMCRSPIRNRSAGDLRPLRSHAKGLLPATASRNSFISEIRVSLLLSGSLIAEGDSTS